MTLRQIFYRLVGGGEIDKTEQSDKALGEKLVRARRAGMVDWDAIRDDGVTALSATYYDDPDDLIDALRAAAERYRRDPMENQPRRILKHTAKTHKTRKRESGFTNAARRIRELKQKKRRASPPPQQQH